MCIADIWTPRTSVRKAKEGETDNDLDAFLTTKPNGDVGTPHPKAMVVILTTSDEVETWMAAPGRRAYFRGLWRKSVQRPYKSSKTSTLIAAATSTEPVQTGVCT